MSRTSVGVPAFSCSVLVMEDETMALLVEDAGPDSHVAIVNDDVLKEELSLGAIKAGGGVRERRNSSTCSKHPRRISYEEIETGSKLKWSSFVGKVLIVSSSVCQRTVSI